MLELNIKCDSTEEAHVYLNAHQYLNLLTDFAEALRSAQKHGGNADVLHQVNVFYPEMLRAIEHHTGAY